MRATWACPETGSSAARRPHRRRPPWRCRNARSPRPRRPRSAPVPIRSDQGPSASIGRPGGAVDHEGGLVGRCRRRPGRHSAPARSARIEDDDTGDRPGSPRRRCGPGPLTIAGTAGPDRSTFRRPGWPRSPREGEEGHRPRRRWRRWSAAGRAAGLPVSSRDKFERQRDPASASNPSSAAMLIARPVVLAPDAQLGAAFKSGDDVARQGDLLRRLAGPARPTPRKPARNPRSGRSGRTGSTARRPGRAEKALPVEFDTGPAHRQPAQHQGICPRPGPGRSDRRCGADRLVQGRILQRQAARAIAQIGGEPADRRAVAGLDQARRRPSRAPGSPRPAGGSRSAGRCRSNGPPPRHRSRYSSSIDCTKGRPARNGQEQPDRRYRTRPGRPARSVRARRRGQATAIRSGGGDLGGLGWSGRTDPAGHRHGRCRPGRARCAGRRSGGNRGSSSGRISPDSVAEKRRSGASGAPSAVRVTAPVSRSVPSVASARSAVKSSSGASPATDRRRAGRPGRPTCARAMPGRALFASSKKCQGRVPCRQRRPRSRNGPACRRCAQPQIGGRDAVDQGDVARECRGQKPRPGWIRPARSRPLRSRAISTETGRSGSENPWASGEGKRGFAHRLAGDFDPRGRKFLDVRSPPDNSRDRFQARASRSGSARAPRHRSRRSGRPSPATTARPGSFPAGPRGWCRTSASSISPWMKPRSSSEVSCARAPRGSRTRIRTRIRRIRTPARCRYRPTAIPRRRRRWPAWPGPDRIGPIPVS